MTQSPITSPQSTTPVEWLCLDIETTAGRPESAEDFCRKFWSPDSRWAPETIGKRYLEAVSKKREKLALLDAAGIAVIAIRDSCVSRPVTVSHAWKAHPPEAREWGLIGGYDGERELLIGLREYLNTCTSADTLIVGHNVRGFDLPRLRFGYLRAGLQLPGILAGPTTDVFDTMREFCRRFSVEREEFISLSAVLEKLGMPNHKDLVDGSQIDALVASGQLEAVLKYAALDVLCESEVFFRLTGTSDQLA